MEVCTSKETIKRNASEQNPAYYIKADNGNHVLKLHSELIS
ncbi:MAG: DUF2945 domain-containing protein [Rickettsia endosymbiont of Argas persicus]